MPNAGARARKYHGRECFILLVRAFFVRSLTPPEVVNIRQNGGKRGRLRACVRSRVRGCAHRGGFGDYFGDYPAEKRRRSKFFHE